MTQLFSWFKKMKKNKEPLKVIGLLVLVVLILSLFSGGPNVSLPQLQLRGSEGSVAYDGAMTSSYYAEESATKLSLRNVLGDTALPPTPGSVPGDDLEEFEVTEYYASIETRALDDTCMLMQGLKEKSYVVFESSNEYDRGCSYSFKVEKDRVETVLTLLEDLNPRELSENTYTIKRQVADYTSEIEILEGKLEQINETLESAVAAYDDITQLARRTQDVESLAKIIDSKITIIERLTQERINVVADLERIERAKNEQLDRLLYTSFSVSVSETTYIDGDQLRDSWRAAVREFVRTVNRVVQNLTINLIGGVLVIAQFLIYAFILFFVLKYLFAYLKKEWKK